jgi:hypothetical protein
MWIVYTIEFIIVLSISLIWVHLIDKQQQYDKNQQDQNESEQSTDNQG